MLHPVFIIIFVQQLYHGLLTTYAHGYCHGCQKPKAGKLQFPHGFMAFIG